MSAGRTVVLFYNPKSGQCTGDHPRLEIEQFLTEHGFRFQTILVPQAKKQLRELVSKAAGEGLNFAMAAGGDGTVSIAADLLMPYNIPLIILPLGTGNLLAKELKIPLKLENALALATNAHHKTFTLDTFSYDDQFYIMNLSVGVSSQIMQKTHSDEKKRFGFFAYFRHFLEQVLGLELKRVHVEMDGRRDSFMATEVMITNSRLLAINPLEWAEDVFIDDGVLDLFIVRAANISDILGFVLSVFTKRTWQNPIVHHFKIRERCRIETSQTLPVQADGDLVGKTPVEVLIHPQSLKILVPSNEKKKN